MLGRLRITSSDALLLVDIQNDFCPGGALAVPDGDAVVPVLNTLVPKFEVIAATRDWHPAGHCSFVAQGGWWPAHCVQGTPGAEYHPELAAGAAAIHVLKGEALDQDCFDGFAGTPDLAAVLRERGITRVFIGGLATEYCVMNTVLGALKAGLAVVA